MTICLPNGLTGCIYGPTSDRQEDKTLFHLRQIDDFLLELNQQYHGGDLYCVYGDKIFAGYWYCLRTAHQATTGLPLVEGQVIENENMKIARPLAILRLSARRVSSECRRV